MDHKLSTFSLVGSVMLRVASQEYTLHAEMSPADALEVARQLVHAAERAHTLGLAYPVDYVRRAPLALPPPGAEA